MTASGARGGRKGAVGEEVGTVAVGAVEVARRRAGAAEDDAAVAGRAEIDRRVHHPRRHEEAERRQADEHRARERGALAHRDDDVAGGQPRRRVDRIAQRSGHLVPPHPVDPVRHPQQAVVAQPVQLHRGGRRRAAPVVGPAPVAKVDLHVTRVHHPPLAHVRQYVGGQAVRKVPPTRAAPVVPGVQHRPQPAGHEPVRVQYVLVDVE